MGGDELVNYMRIVKKRQSATVQDTPAAIAMGFFDGVHIGHQAVLRAVAQYGDAHHLRKGVFTFEKGPKGDAQGRLLITEQQKHQCMRDLGMDTCYQPVFSSFSHLSPTDFFYQVLLEEYHAKALFCGEDFRFGALRAGDIHLLQQLCQENHIHLCIVPLTDYLGEEVSSSRIRLALAQGDIPAVNAMLGRPYTIDFPVQYGKGLGSKLGMPTINQIFPQNIQTPAYGVYITQTRLEGECWPSATGFGTRPTVDDGAPSCETFIPGYTGSLYEKSIPVSFYEKIADPVKFQSLEELSKQVARYAKMAQEYFKKSGQ